MSEIQRTLEVAASTRVLHQRRREALEATGARALLGRHFLTLRGLAEACAAETGVAIRGELGGLALARIVRQCAPGIAVLGPLVARQPGTALALAATLRDLRDAGVPPNALPDAVGSLRTLYEACERTLSVLEREGLFDRIGLFRLARRGAADWVQRLGLCDVGVHGATELVGSAGDLVEALGEVAEVRVHQPDWGNAYTRELRQTWPWRLCVEPKPVLAQPALPAGGKIPEDGLHCAHAPGPREELEFVAHEILHRIEAGVSPSGICVVARALETYAPWIVSVLGRYGIPFTSSLSEPILSRAFVRARLNLARTLARDLEPQPTLELLRSLRLRWSRLSPSPEAAHKLPQLAEALARQGRVLRGLDDWLRAIHDAPFLLRKEQRTGEPEELELLARVLRELDEERARWCRSASWEELAVGLSSVAERWLRGPESEEERALDTLAEGTLKRLESLDRIDRVCGRGTATSQEEFVSTLETALGDTRRRPLESDEGGVRVLDALQDRAIPSKHLFLLGLNHGSWPLELREDPFLPAPIRERLRRQTGRPIPVPRIRDAEDRFLLGLLLSQARRSVTLTWHARDAAGRERSPSMYLHDLPYVAQGTSVLDRAQPVSPRSLEGFLSPGDALRQAALTLGAEQGLRVLPDLASQIVPEQEAQLAAGLELLAVTESRTSQSLLYDGWVGANHMSLAESYSPSFLELLGQCPQRAFFSRLLRVPEFDTPPLHALDAREAGIIVHRVLRRIYGELFSEDFLAGSRRAEEALARAVSGLPQAIGEEAWALRERLEKRQRTLWEALERQIREAAMDFMARDLPELLSDGVVALRLEEEVELTRSFDGTDLRVRGTADRILERASGEIRVSDYKTRRDPRDLLRPSRVRRGTALQIPLYVLAVGDECPGRQVVGEVLAVPLRPERDRDQRRARTPLLSLEDADAQASPALGVLSRVLRTGSFPFRRDAQCRHCAYVAACRKAQPQSEERLRSAAPFAEYFSLHGDPG